MASFNYSFTTTVTKFAIPASYDDSFDMSGQPAGWTLVKSGDGNNPTFAGGFMNTDPGTTGTSYINKNFAGLDFDTGVLIDFIIRRPPALLPQPDNRIVKVLRVTGSGVVSVSADVSKNEIWLNDVVNIPLTDFRARTTILDTFVRLTIKGSGDNLVARLYTGDSSTSCVLNQTDGPSSSLIFVDSLNNLIACFQACLL